MRGRPALLVAVLALVAALVGRGRAQTAAGPTLLFGGDVIFDDTTTYALRQMGASRDDAASYAPMFEELDLDGADLTVVNLETPVAERIRDLSGEGGLPTFGAPPAFLEALVRAGVDAVGVANNHAYDQGTAGLGETLARARELGVVTLGAGSTRRDAFAATILVHDGTRIAIVAATDGTNQVPGHGEADGPRIALLGEDLLEASLGEARRAADLVVADLHWTSASTALPTPDMQRIVERAAIAGADLVVAHGPHVLGPLLTIHTPDGRDVPVLVSLGNLAAVMQADDDELFSDHGSVRDAVLARVTTRRSASGRLEVAAITPRAFFISASRRQLFPDGRTRFVRPLSIDLELQRATVCGPPCTELRAGYEARRARIAGLFASSPAPAPSLPPSPAPSLPPSPSPSLPPAPSDGLIDLGLVFAPGSARLASHDEATVVALAARLRADHSLSVLLVSHPGPSEGARIADRRAHATRGLLSILGPSRARFEISTGGTADTPRVDVIVRRR